jgi:deoxyribodipyrimidine photo-lyase
MTPRSTIVWFRNDLRVDDHPALRAAAERGGAVIPVYIWAPEEEGGWPPGAASRVWLHDSLRALDAALRERASRLTIARGPSAGALLRLAELTGADAVIWNRRYEPAAIKRDAAVAGSLLAARLQCDQFRGNLLYEPWEVRTGGGGPFQVFTPFWKACLKSGEPLAATGPPRDLRPPRKWPRGLPLPALGLEPSIDWASGIRAAWAPGEAGAMKQLRRFLSDAFEGYADGRNWPGEDGTSRLSPHLHSGEISIRRVREAIEARAARARGRLDRAAERFLAELGWREFAHHLLFHFPHTPRRPLRERFASFPWRRDRRALDAWKRGRTGFPIVDAAMRQLWTTGWMHNRARMIVASFLVKDLLLPWQLGARWFWDTLVDADLANNTLGWQWTAGCGADAAPYFRVFNPVAQGRTFDPDGAYVRLWVPELAGLPDRFIHEPAAAPGDVCAAAGIRLGREYPSPIVDHAAARTRALAAFRRIRRGQRAEPARPPATYR